MTTTKPLTGPLLNSGSRALPRSTEFVSAMFDRYGVKKYAIYVDHTTVANELPKLKDYEIAGYYTFDLNLAAGKLAGSSVNLLGLNNTPDNIDGWLVASTSRAAAFSLADALMNTGHEDQVIVRFYGGQTTEITAYMDVLSGETETILYLNHYYDRKYRIVFPIEVRYAFCECDGTVRQSGQRIIKPGGITTFDTSTMDLGDFKGYMRVELEVENLQVRVQPFIHFWADYVSDAGMCRNHQSGWSPWPPGTVFNRGYLPADGEHEAIASIYNENDQDVEVRALLHFTRDGIEETFEKSLVPVPSGEMSYQNLSDLFSGVSLEGVNAAYVLLTCDLPLHRPNFYIAKKGTGQFVDTYHQTGGKACHWAIPSYGFDKSDVKKLSDAGIQYPWAVDLPILPEKSNIETFLGLLSLTLCSTSGFGVDFYDDNGTMIASESFPFDGRSPIFTNINTWAKEMGVSLPNGGMARFRADSEAGFSDMGATVTCGLKHKDFPHFSTTFVGSHSNQNIEHYLHAAYPKSREFKHSPLALSDHFAPGVNSDQYDSLFIVRHSSLLNNYSKVCTYRLDVIDQDGKQYSCHRTVNPQTFDIFWMSEILDDLGLSSAHGYFTLWVKSYDTLLKPYHLLVRKSDKAMSLDDGSEGTLQVDPQIGGVDGERTSFEGFLHTINKTEIAQHIPENMRQKLRKILLKY